ncbi:MAG: tetratricopeptide repeat protein [Candidatus Omnitrophica bacterium]|nr:tetratricopeptide repeat protein [Candidatus Omnitrophota bacterium]
MCFKKIKKQKVIFYTTAMIFTSCAYLLIRYNATRSLGVQSPLHENKVALALTMLNVITDNIRLLLWPSNLSTSDAFLISRSIMENYTFVSFMIISALIAIAIYYLKKDKLISFCLFWFFITLLPVLNIIPILYLRADHFLYIPSLGFCILTAAILHKNRAFLRHSLIIILIFSILTISRNKDWQNEISLFSKSIKSHPQAKEAHACLGFAYHQKGLHEKASHHYKKALISNPSYYSFSRPGRILENLANIYYAGHLYKWAEKYYQMALEFEPEDGNIHLGLGNVYYEQNQYQKAIDSYQASLRYSPSNSSAHHNLSKAYEKQVGLKK